jgi:YVTN family beta-propeller protein
MKSSQMSGSDRRKIASCGSAALFVAVAAVLCALTAPKKADAAPTRSTTIALTSDETRVVVVNREANSVSVIRVKNANGKDINNKLAEIPVGEEPRCVAVSPDDRLAFVANGISGTVSIVSLVQNRVVKTISVGTEPRGCALTADGSLLYVANHTEGTVSIIDTASLTVAGAVQVGGRPLALAITDTGTGNISDDTVFVTEIFAELNPDFNDPNFDGNGEGRDLGKQGVVHAFPAGNANPPITPITLKPLADSNFNANRTAPNNFCNTVPPAQSQIFCPRPDLPATDPANTNTRRECSPTNSCRH